MRKGKKKKKPQKNHSLFELQPLTSLTQQSNHYVCWMPVYTKNAS